MLAHWNNSQRVDMSLHSDTLFWFRANQSLLFLQWKKCQSSLIFYCKIPILCQSLAKSPQILLVMSDRTDTLRELCPHKRNPGRFALITCSPRKVSRFTPLNCYYIIIDEVFFEIFWVIIYLLVHSCIQKK
jgi:hypothetical protein